MNELTYGISIYVEDSGKTFHTLNDWNLALGNNNYIGDPEMETTYIQVPGRNGLIDASEVVAGRRIYIKRALELGRHHFGDAKRRERSRLPSDNRQRHFVFLAGTCLCERF